MAHCWLIRPDAQHIHHVVKVPKIIREVLLYRRRDKDTAAARRYGHPHRLGAYRRGADPQGLFQRGSIPSMTRMLDQLVEVIATPTGQGIAPVAVELGREALPTLSR